METVTDFISWTPKSLQMVTAAMKFKDLGRKAMTNFRQHIKKQRHYFADNGLSSQSYGFSSCHVWMSELTIKKAEHQRLMLLNCCAGEDS